MSGSTFRGLALACVAPLIIASVPAFGAASFSLDQNCNGTSDSGALECEIWKEPITGLDTVLYTLPGSVLGGMTSGDFRLIGPAGTVVDVYRFDAARGGVFVLSDPDEGPPGMADVGAPILPVSPFLNDFWKYAADGSRYYSYSPDGAEHPGWFGDGAAYEFYSVAAVAVPEPPVALLMALGLAGLALRQRKSRV